jgi:hypothetical protein
MYIYLPADIKPVQTMEQGSGVVLDMGEGEPPMVTEWRLYLVQEWWVTLS